MKKGSKCSEIAKKNMSISHIGKPSGFKGKHHSDGAKKKISISQIGRIPYVRTKEMRENARLANINKVVSDEIKTKISKSVELLWKDTNYRDKRKDKPIGMKGKHHTEYAKQRIRVAQTGRHHTEETKQKLSVSHNGQIPWNFGVPQSEEQRNQMKRKWLEPKWRERTISAIMFASHLRPNGAELKLNNIIQEAIPNEYKYTGDGSLIVGGKCPDFCACNDCKKLIELYGNYWHKKDNPQDKIDYFKDHGYDCLVIWEHELNEKEVLVNKIKKFHNNEAITYN